ncbi:MAG: class I SAM-dependent methyltransferase [Nitrospinae bacterium]|nr:class I SAM-dependent methyltransferase [Nitrospinota bacterium]
MENLLTYADSVIKKNIWTIEEATEKYYRLLDRATVRFNEKMEALEQRCLDHRESPEVLFRGVTEAITDMRKVCEEFELGVDYDKILIKEAQNEFREKTKHLISKSYFNRARIWPQGYQGDYMMLDAVYRNTPLSSGIGYYLDKYFLSATLAVAVRERRITLRKLLEREIKNRKTPKILDIACGSSREVFELASDIEKSGAKLTCIDFDSDALAFSADRLSYTGLSSENLEFRKYNALKMVNHNRNLKEFGMQDIIYSTGLYDYLGDDVLILLLGSLYKLLTPGGSLIASFKDCHCYKTFDTQWLLAWDGFLQRTEEQFWALIKKAEIPLSVITTTRENSGVIIFFTATK